MAGTHEFGASGYVPQYYVLPEIDVPRVEERCRGSGVDNLLDSYGDKPSPVKFVPWRSLFGGTGCMDLPMSVGKRTRIRRLGLNNKLRGCVLTRIRLYQASRARTSTVNSQQL